MEPGRLPVRARLVGADGRDEPIRLWPTAELGVFEGRFEAPPAGTYDLQVSTATGASADEVVTVVADARHAARTQARANDALRLIAASTGGVAVERFRLDPLERHLRGLTSGEVERPIRPARSMAMLVTLRRVARGGVDNSKAAGDVDRVAFQRIAARIGVEPSEPRSRSRSDREQRSDRHLHHLPPRRPARVAEHRGELRARPRGAGGFCRGAEDARRSSSTGAISKRSSAA